MNTKETARKWDCKADWVSRYCRDGMIPMAELINGRWNIPENAIKPPCTAKQAVIIMENIWELLTGKKVNVFSPSIRKDADRIIHYLGDEGFISPIENADDLYSDNANIQILARGYALIKKHRVNDPSVEKELNLSLGVYTPLLNAAAQYRIKKTEE